jgi:DNA-binding NarL/FixJ family response regulator
VRVLVVDDNQSFLDAARLLLEGQGVQVVGVALTSAEALRRAAELRPEVILVDVMLGRESGLDLTRRLADQDGGAAAVILISTLSRADLAELAVDSRAAGFLPKSELSADAIGRIVAGGAPAGL